MLRYLRYCQPGTPFFDEPPHRADAGQHREALPELPDGWREASNDEWWNVTPPDAELPAQGWKIHVSATLENAARVLAVVWDYCVPRGIAFKFVRSSAILARRNNKYGDRSASGKFVAIYPADEAELELILNELGVLLRGERGPYILSDLRWEEGPLFVRYGGFRTMTRRDQSGALVYLIEDPHGQLVPDRRGPSFRPPEWVTLPSCLSDAVAAREAGRLVGFPYRATQALHFSNGGGVYLAVDTRTGGEVLLREARPLAGLDGNGTDALGRLEREKWALEQLDGIPGIPRMLDYRLGSEHYFLVREYVDGVPLSAEAVRRNPLLRGATSRADMDEFTNWAIGVLSEVERTLAAMHARGVVFGDLHPGNVLVGPLGPSGTVSFIDFETASRSEDRAAQAMGAVGFSAPPGYAGEAVDRYALGCLRLAMFVPLAGSLIWGPDKLDQVLELVASTFPVPAEFTSDVRRDLGQAPHLGSLLGVVGPPSEAWVAPSRSDWPARRLGTAEGILALAEPARTDRLYPGDAQQFFTPEGGLDMATGAAGVLWALTEAGIEVPAAHVEWLLEGVDRLTTPQVGFYDGLSGIAYALAAAGRGTEAAALMARVDASPADDLGHSLHGGLAGIGLARLRLAKIMDDDAALEAAATIGDLLVARTPDAGAAWPQPGLMHGAAGPALFWLRLFEQTADEAHLDRAEECLRADLAAFRWRPDEEFGEQHLARVPFIAGGCGGTGMVLHDLVRYRPAADLIEVRDGIRSALASCFTVQAGLFHGRAGAIVALLHLNDGPVGAEGSLRRHVDALGLQHVVLAGRTAVLGRDSLRLSADLSTGAAGVLLALDGALTERRATLPFFG